MNIGLKSKTKKWLLKAVRKINIHKLMTDGQLMRNPYSIIHPCYLLYIWGRLEASDEILVKASAELANLIQNQIDEHDYTNAGEFLILKLKIEGHIRNNSNTFFRTYEKGIELFEKSSVLENGPYYLESIAELKELAQKYGDIEVKQSDMDLLYRQIADVYRKKAEKIKEKRLQELKIVQYFQAINYLEKIKVELKPNDDKIKQIMANKIITISLRILKKFKDKKLNLKFTDKKHKINLNYHMGKAYKILNKKEQAQIFLEKAIRALEKLEKEPSFEDEILESKRLLHKDDGYYRIHNIRIFSEKSFKEITGLLERIDFLELKEKLVNNLNDLDLKERKDYEKPEKISQKIIMYYQKLIDLFNDKTKKIEEASLRNNKLKALIVFFLYKSYKILKKREK